MSREKIGEWWETEYEVNGLRPKPDVFPTRELFKSWLRVLRKSEPKVTIHRAVKVTRYRGSAEKEIADAEFVADGLAMANEVLTRDNGDLRSEVAELRAQVAKARVILAMVTHPGCAGCSFINEPHTCPGDALLRETAPKDDAG